MGLWGSEAHFCVKARSEAAFCVKARFFKFFFGIFSEMRKNVRKFGKNDRVIFALKRVLRPTFALKRVLRPLFALKRVLRPLFALNCVFYVFFFFVGIFSEMRKNARKFGKNDRVIFALKR